MDADHDEGMFTGRVVTDEATPRPVADALAAIRCARDCANFLVVGKADANADGQFSLTRRLDSGDLYSKDPGTDPTIRYNVRCEPASPT